MNKKKLINWINLLVTIAIFIAIFIYLYFLEMEAIKDAGNITLHSLLQNFFISRR